ncbi:MAG: hypothetical protein K8S14_08105, partial [Actinomycetia bacterium]|nr:hypothetical protein [Actinomycetes bacterium]
MNFNEMLYEKISRPFFAEVNLKNHLIFSNKENINPGNSRVVKRKQIINLIEKKLSLCTTVFLCSKEEIQAITKEFYHIEQLLNRLINEV